MDYGNDKEWQVWKVDWNLHLSMQSQQRRIEVSAPTHVLPVPFDINHAVTNNVNNWQPVQGGQMVDLWLEQFVNQSNYNAGYRANDWSIPAMTNHRFNQWVSCILWCHPGYNVD